MKRLDHQKGFTLLELLIVIGILAVLATITILVINPVQQINNARTRGTQQSIDQLADAMIKIKGFTGTSLVQITGSVCSDCPCRITTATVDTIPTCITNWDSALANITAMGTSSAVTSDLSAFTRDSWGDPFLLDENEGEFGGCGHDILRSAGPDRIYGTADDIYPHGSATYIINTTPACQ